MAFITCIQTHILINHLSCFSEAQHAEHLKKAQIPECGVSESESYHWIRWKESPRDSVKVGEGELDACVGEAQLVDVGGSVSRADVALSRKGRHRDGVFQLVLRKVVRDSSIHVSLNGKR